MNEGRRITRSAGQVGLTTLASRILGLLRDAVVAACFPKAATDAFFVAFTIPNALRRLTGEGALTAAFLPVFTECLEREGQEPARSMLASMLGVGLVVLASLSMLGAGLSPWFVRAFAYGFVADPPKFQLAVLLTRVMFFFLVTTGLTALAMGVLHSCRHFLTPAAAPVLLNAVIIVAALTLSSLMTALGAPAVLALAVGVVLGGLGQVLLQIPALARYGMLVGPRWNYRHPGVARVGRLLLPSLFGFAIYELNVIIARQFASFLPEGSVSCLYYAQRLVEFPMGIFVVALATVAMPSLSSHAAAGELEQLKQTYRYALRLVLFIMLPATAGLAGLALPITAVLFQRGAFGPAMTARTAATLLGLLAGLWAGAGARQTAPVFYALQDAKTPVKVAGVSLIIYALVALLLYRPLETVGLALAVSCSSVVNFGLLLLLLRRRLGRLGLSQLGLAGLRCGSGAFVCGLTAWLVAGGRDWVQASARLGGLMHLLLALVAGLGAYGLVMWLSRAPELGELTAALRRSRAAVPDPVPDRPASAAERDNLH